MTKKIRLKNGITGDVLHPETEWGAITETSSVKIEETDNFINITAPGKNLDITTDKEVSLIGGSKIDLNSGSVSITSSESDIAVTDKKTLGKRTELKDYPLSEGALSKTNLGCFGIILDPTNPTTTYPAFRIKYITSSSVTYRYFYLSPTGILASPISGAMRFQALNSSSVEIA